MPALSVPATIGDPFMNSLSKTLSYPADPTAITGVVVAASGVSGALTVPQTCGDLFSNSLSAAVAFAVAETETKESEVTVVDAATQAQMEAATSNTVGATPFNTQFHPGTAKVFIRFTTAGNIIASYNVASVDDDGPGSWGVNFTTQFSSATTNAPVLGRLLSAAVDATQLGAQATPVGSIEIINYDTITGALSDGTLSQVSCVCYGDQ